MAELQKMYTGKAFSPSTNLTKPIGALDTIIQVDDISVFPPAPNLATINDGDGTGETILYTALTSNSLSGCKRGFQGEAKEHNAGFEIGRYFTDYDYATLIKNVNSLNVNKVENIPGKQLSTEDFTKEEKTKLSTLDNYDDTTINQNIEALSQDNIAIKQDIGNLQTETQTINTTIEELKTSKADVANVYPKIETYSRNEIDEKISSSSGVEFDGAGYHNSIYRGKNLGTSVTPEQYEACRNGTFKDLFLGDYWTINGTVYFIVGFNYWYNTGYEPICKTNHINVMPLYMLYLQRMNAKDTQGGYMGSEMYKTGLNQAKEKINTDFGAEHILSHRLYLSNSVANGRVNGCAWADSTVELPTEEMMYGGNIFTSRFDGTGYPQEYKIGKSQLPVFKARPDLISNRQNCWLQNIVNTEEFAISDTNGSCSRGLAYYGGAGVRPEFAIH